MLQRAAKDTGYLRHYNLVLSQYRNYMETRGCPYLEVNSHPDPFGIVYFSAEYGLHRSLPFYAGGLGFLAGDHIKECSDLNVPLAAVGFMYPSGYLSQRINNDGWQEHVDQEMDREAAAISKVLKADGEQLTVEIPLIHPPVHAAVWKVSVGRIPLFLLDTDTELNAPWNRGISARLYVGDLELRLRQEIVLGIGGSKVLDVLGVKRAVLHLNEGHPAFAILERIRDCVASGLSFEESVNSGQGFEIFELHEFIFQD